MKNVKPASDIKTRNAGSSASKSKVSSVRKTTKLSYRSDAFEAIHTAAEALHSLGVVSKRTMREFNEDCLEPSTFDAKDVLRIRQKVQVSQEVFARYMGITKSTVVKWESAQNKPSAMAQRLLKIIDKLGIEALT